MQSADLPFHNTVLLSLGQERGIRMVYHRHHQSDQKKDWVSWQQQQLLLLPCRPVFTVQWSEINSTSCPVQRLPFVSPFTLWILINFKSCLSISFLPFWWYWSLEMSHKMSNMPDLFKDTHVKRILLPQNMLQIFVVDGYCYVLLSTSLIQHDSWNPKHGDHSNLQYGMTTLTEGYWLQLGWHMKLTSMMAHEWLNTTPMVMTF